MIFGTGINLAACNNELWHEFYKNYVSDSMMENTAYTYNYENVEKNYYSKIGDTTRLYFFIVLEKNVIGQIYLKHMDKENKTTEIGIALINDSIKNKGYGTEAIKLLINYAFNTLGFEKILADTVLRNIRSRHVLEKLGFKLTHEDVDFKFYELKRHCLEFNVLDIDKFNDFIVAAHKETFFLTFGHEMENWQIEKEIERERRDGTGVFLHNEIIGLCDLEIRKGNNNEEYAWVHFFYLAPKFRGQGLGKQLIFYAEEFCHTHNLTTLGLRTGKHNFAARNFYERHGFVLESKLNNVFEVGYIKIIKRHKQDERK